MSLSCAFCPHESSQTDDCTVNSTIANTQGLSNSSPFLLNWLWITTFSGTDFGNLPGLLGDHIELLIWHSEAVFKGNSKSIKQWRVEIQ